MEEWGSLSSRFVSDARLEWLCRGFICDSCLLIVFVLQDFSAMCDMSPEGARFSLLAGDSLGSSSCSSSMASEMLPRISMGPMSRHADVLVVVQLVLLGAVTAGGGADDNEDDDVVVAGWGDGSAVKFFSVFLISIRIISSSGSGIRIVRSSLTSDDESECAMPN